MFNLQGSEIIFILLLALVVLGPEKLPGAIKRFTQTYAEIRKMGSGFQTELKSALDEPMREMRETAGLIRESADPSKIIAEADAKSPLEAEREAERALRAQQSAEEPGSEGMTADRSVPDATAPDVEPIDEWADPVEVVDVADVNRLGDASAATDDLAEPPGEDDSSDQGRTLGRVLQRD